MKALASKIPNIMKDYDEDPTKYERNLLKVEIFFDSFYTITLAEFEAYSVCIQA